MIGQTGPPSDWMRALYSRMVDALKHHTEAEVPTVGDADPSFPGPRDVRVQGSADDKAS